MIIFVQPFGLSSPGGGPRILRALLQDAPIPFLSVCTSTQPPPSTGIGPEHHVAVRPNFGRLESTRLARYFWYMAPLWAERFRDRLERLCRDNTAHAIHAIPHGMDFWYAFQVAQRLGIAYYINIHDELAYNLRGRPDRIDAERHLATVWQRADGRIVISEAMGQEYCRRFGKQSYSIVTDGLAFVPPCPAPRPHDSLRVYFAGAAHLSYKANMLALTQALNAVQAAHPSWNVSLTCRGSAWPQEGATFTIKSLGWGSEQEVASDLDEADLLYLPLPFEKEFAAFSRYSLSTKMVTYLGSGLPILYHGPGEAAAAELLKEHEAAVMAYTLEPPSIADSIATLPSQRQKIVCNALKLASRQFMLCDQREIFWQMLANTFNHFTQQNSFTQA